MSVSIQGMHEYFESNIFHYKKFTLEEAMNAQRGSIDITLLFL